MTVFQKNARWVVLCRGGVLIEEVEQVMKWRCKLEALLHQQSTTSLWYLFLSVALSMKITKRKSLKNTTKLFIRVGVVLMNPKS